MGSVIGFYFFVFGACFGSFANVVIYRLPKGESIITPRSRCMACGQSIAWTDNIPIISWFLLRGRCRKCRASYSFRYPLVELIMASLFLGLYLKLGFSWLLLEYLVFTFGLVTVSFIDFDHMILPDVFTLSGIVLGLTGALINPERDFLSSLWGMLLGGGSLYAVAVIYSALRKQEGMGGGDIKLLAWIGALLGWTSVPFVVLSSSVIGSIVGSVSMIKKKDGLSHAIPFGPYLALGALLYIFCGKELSELYIYLFIPSLGTTN
ncbi:MAG: peptidase A24 [Bdellovibrionales bacterium RBG_16_40_8]|nr:MAG: peptidase A24 [Bdellovibrionales bacterium RBG_16_40_8]